MTNTKINPQTDITSLILAGGRGSRLGGQDKGLIDWSGAPLIETVLSQIRAQTPNIVISANRNLERYRTYGYRVIADGMPDHAGPLAGILAVLEQIDTPWLVTLPCDAPYIAPDYVNRLIKSMESARSGIAVCHDGERMQPLHALLSTDMLDNLQAYLDSGERAVNHWFRKNHAARADFSDRTDMFANINTPEQHKELLP